MFSGSRWRQGDSSRHHYFRLTPFAGLIALSLLLLPAVAYAAGTISVDTPTDDFGSDTQNCALREAVETANSNSDFGGCSRAGTAPFTIILPAGDHLLTLPGASEDANASGDLDVRAGMTISGTGAAQSVIHSGDLATPGIDRVLHISTTEAVTITGVTIRNGVTANGDENGGGIANTAGASLYLMSSSVISNTSLGDAPGEGGGGIYNAISSTLTLSNTSVVSNSALSGLGNGGGIFNAGTVLVDGGEIANNRAARAGGGIESDAGQMTLRDSALTNNNAGINGGGLHISAAGVVTVTGGTATGNSAAEEGGAFWNSGPGLLTVESVTISGNRATGNAADQGGGGIFSDGGTLTISNTTIISNSAAGTAGSGGGILIVPGSTLTITGGTIDNNLASRAGGGIEVNGNVTESVTANLTAVTLTANATGANPGNGGALHITGPATVTVTGGEVISNTAAAEGGGLWNSAVGTLLISGTVVSGNQATGAAADQGGGGIFNDGGILVVTNSTLRNNRAEGDAGSGGAILIAPGSTAEINGGLLENNRASRAGGGVEVNATVTNTAAITLTSVEVISNTTGANPGNGGGLHITGAGSALVSTSSVLSNTASAEGGGLWNSATGRLVVDRSTLSNNTANGVAADQGGGAIHNDGGELSVSNSTVSGNQSAAAGGGLNNLGTAALINVTIYENSAITGAGGINNSAGLTITNSIIAHVEATGADCSGVTAGDFNLDSDESCQAAITGDPRLSPLRSYGGPTMTHALAFGSPALDAGDAGVCAAPPINNQDQRGTTRPLGAACDLGAYEGGAVSMVTLFPLILNDGP